MAVEMFDSELLVPLHAAPTAGQDLVGTKAATLGRLATAGFAVPEGVVLTTRAAAAAPVAGAGSVEAGRLPEAVEEALAAVRAHFGDAELAVRSSAPDEDGAEASFAGQYDTVLHVRGPDELRRAVVRCWASAQGDRVRAYSGSREVGPVAVLVQRQLPVDVGGVAFTANPVTGATDEVLVSAVPGPGAELAAGAVSPDEWVVKGSAAEVVRGAHQALAEAQARAVAVLARQVEAVLGGPQDLEWAMAGGRLLVLQSRPITALPTPPTAELPEGTWFKDVEHYAEPFTAFGASIAEEAVASGLTQMFEDFGALLDRMEVRVVGGEVYTRPAPLGGRQGPPPPGWVLGLLARLAPPVRTRMRAARRMVRPEMFEDLRADWESIQRPRLGEEAGQLRAVDLAGLSAVELEAHLGRAVDLLQWGLHVHFRLIPTYTVTLYELVEACRDLLGWGEPEALQLVAGTSTASSAPTRALSELARRAAAHPGASAAVRGSGPDLADRLAGIDAGLAGAFSAWCDRYGYRCVHDDPASPVWMERPGLLGRLFEELVERHSNGEETMEARVEIRKREAVERARRVLAEATRRDRDRFDRSLAAAARFYPLREDTAFWAAGIPAGVVRLAVVEAGRRLCVDGRVGHPDDAAHLPYDVVRAALGGQDVGDLRALVRRARAERAWVRHHPGPLRHGPAVTGGTPDLRWLPRPARLLNRALAWGQPGRPTSGSQQADEAGGVQVLTGAPASTGEYTGPARVVRGEDDFPAFRPGDVLVCPTTDPAWSVLFGMAGALVTDHGGVLAHAAIVAREHGIPAVLGTGAATRLIGNGDLVTVSGVTGRVTWPGPRNCVSSAP